MRFVSLAALVCLMFTRLAAAQATATLNGRIVDPGGAVLPGVTVTITNTGTGVTRTTVTNGEGLYSLPALERGVYDLKSELEGFAMATRRAVELFTGSTITFDFTMALAQLSETLTVQAQAPLVEGTQSAVTSTIRQAEVAQLPMLNRSLAAMITLLPGAREAPTAGAHGHAASYVSFGGGSGRNFQMLVDGADNKEDQDGGTTMVYSLEGVQEFKVLTSNFTAEYGRAPYVVVLATKAGANQLHGSIFGYWRNQDLTTPDYFSKRENGGLGKQPFERLQYGGSVGGPIKRDRAWFFGSLERVQQDFTLPRPENLVQELKYLEPLNVGAVASTSISQPFRDLLAQGKVNLHVSNNHNAFVRGSLQKGHVDNSFQTTGRASLAYAPVTDRNIQSMWAVSGGWSWIISPTTVNQFTAQYMYYNHDNAYPECKRTVTAGIVDWTPCLSGNLTFPSVSAGLPFSGGFPHWYNLENKIELRDDFSKQVGSHAFKTGFDYMPIPLFGGFFGGVAPGNINFFDDPSVIVNNTNGRYPQGFQTPGIVRSVAVTSGTIGDQESKDSWNFGVYFQDDYKVSPRVTLNLGIRYDVYQYMNQPELPKNRLYLVLKAVGSPFGALPKTDTNNVAPRLGVAWDVRGDGRDVIRGGYGTFFGQGIMNSYFNQNFGTRDVIFYTQTYTNTAIGAGALANYVYGVSPLPTAPLAPTEYPVGQAVQDRWYDPALQDRVTHQFHVGMSHSFDNSTVLAADYSHILGLHGWRLININPLLDHDNNPATPRVRPLADATFRVYGDRNLLGPVNLVASLNRSLYDELAVHFERRFSQTASIQTNYTLAWARGMGGVSDGTTGAPSALPQIGSATGGDLTAPWERGPSAFDERHRITVAGVLNLPFGIDVSPSFTAATARPYTQFRATNPTGDGSLQLLCSSGDSADVGFGAGQVPCGVNNARGIPLANASARVTKNFAVGSDKISVFAEFYNITNRANFGANFNGNAFAPATYNKPNGYLGGIGSTSTIPNSFQVQFGGRWTF